MKNRFASLAVAASVVLGLAGVSRATEYKLDPIHSMAIFQISHLGVSNPFGRFPEASGTVTVNGDNISMTVAVPVGKVDMHNEAWEKHIKSADFFNAKEFPDISFTSKEVKKTGENTYEATGDLTCHGVTKPVTVTLTKGGELTDPKTKEQRIVFNTTFKINRSDFGMNYGKGMIGDEVVLMVNIEAKTQPQ